MLFDEIELACNDDLVGELPLWLEYRWLSGKNIVSGSITKVYRGSSCTGRYGPGQNDRYGDSCYLFV